MEEEEIIMKLVEVVSEELEGRSRSKYYLHTLYICMKLQKN